MHKCTKWKVNSCPCFNTYKWPQQSSHGVSSSWLYGGSLLLMKSLFMWVERTSCSPVSILSASDVSSVASRLMLSKPSLLPYTHKNTANQNRVSGECLYLKPAVHVGVEWFLMSVFVPQLNNACNYTTIYFNPCERMMPFCKSPPISCHSHMLCRQCMHWMHAH